MSLEGLKVIVYEKPNEYLDFKTTASDGTCKSISIDLLTFQHVITDYAFLRVKVFGENVRENILLPTRDCLREHYNIGDRVYIAIFNSVLIYGIIEYKKDNGFYVLYFKNAKSFRPANQIIPYNYYLLHANCRLAIKQWLFVSRRLNVCKDLRKLIASYIWNLRNEYEWDCTCHKHTHWRSVHKKRIKYKE